MNPFELNTEEQLELINKTDEIVILANKVETMEIKLKERKKEEEDFKKAKEDLRKRMIARGVKTWTLTSGTKITATEDTPSKDNFVIKFCEELFKKDYPDLYKDYCKEFNDKTSPRKGSLRITLSKENN